MAECAWLLILCVLPTVLVKTQFLKETQATAEKFRQMEETMREKEQILWNHINQLSKSMEATLENMKMKIQNLEKQIKTSISVGAGEHQQERTQEKLTEEETILIKEWEGNKFKEYNKEWYRQGSTLLHFVSQEGQIDVVRALLSRGDSVDATRNDGETPLHVASAWGRTHVVRLLIQNGADVNHNNDGGWTPLHWASWAGHASTVEVLIKAGAKVNTKSIKEWDFFPAGSTPLHMASYKAKEPELRDGCKYVIRVLLGQKADKNIENRDGKKPRDLAIRDDVRRLFDE